MTVPVYLDDTQNDEDTIRQRMLARVPSDVDVSEGSYVWDALAPAAMELVFVSLLAQYVLEQSFAQTAAGDYLTYRAAEHGVIRRSAVKSTGSVTITGTAGTTFTAGLLLATEGDESVSIQSIQFITTAAVTLNSTGSGTVSIEAVEAGASGNVPAARIVVLMSANSHIRAVTNSDATSGGVDEEDDDTLRTRYLEKVRTPGTSGNIADYKQWAEEVSGVTDVHVLPLWNGPGTVKLVILGPNKLPPDSSLIQEVQAYIAPTTGGERKAPIGAAVTVVGADSVPINITASIVLDGTEALSTIKDKFVTALTEYLAGVAFQVGTIRYARIGSILIEQSGVADYVSLTVNAGNSNIEISDNQVATVGTVTINV